MIIGITLAVFGLLLLWFGIRITSHDMLYSAWMWLVPIIGAALLVFGLIMALDRRASGHESEQWINDNSLTDPVSKQWCCGPSDCHALEPGDVHETTGGWMIKTPVDKESEFIPYKRALPVSPDGRFHRCVAITNGVTESRCFIVPPNSY